jgi:hypothetical protein
VTKTKARIAAAVTVVGLAGLTGWALSADRRQAAQTVAEKPIVRTKVIRRTIHVTKHAKPKHPAVAAPPAAGASSSPEAVSTGSSGSAYSEEPVSTATSGSGSTEPVSTATSGSAGGGGSEAEFEGGGDGGGEGGGDD